MSVALRSSKNYFTAQSEGETDWLSQLDFGLFVIHMFADSRVEFLDHQFARARDFLAHGGVEMAGARGGDKSYFFTHGRTPFVPVSMTGVMTYFHYSFRPQSVENIGPYQER